MPLAVTDRDYWVSITSASCNYGGLRFWFTRLEEWHLLPSAFAGSCIYP